MPLERLEARICEVAGHLAAATCRFLVLLGEFDERRGWASWEMNSCAAWLSWKCQLSSGTAREHVRVARALRVLPVIRGEFAAARLSYAKVRALTRIATPATEEGLAEIAGPMTGNQLERFARAYRQCSRADDAASHIRRRLAWRFEEDGSLAGTFRLPPLQGAVLLRALRAAAADVEPGDVSAETPPAGRPVLMTSSDLADALAVVAESFLAGKVAGADDAEVYQVVLHVGTDVITTPPGGEPGSGPAGVSATPEHAPAAVPGTDPADPARCHVEDGDAVSVTTAQVITCTAALSWMLHGRDGAVLDLGRRRRRPSAALRKAARERDRGRCRYPGCESRQVDLHHIQYWSNGGRTTLENLISLCKYHHTAVHDRGYLIAAGQGGKFTFYQPDGTALPPCPPLPSPDGGIDRPGPRRRHHPGHDHPALVRRTARPGPGHLHLPGQREAPRRPRGRPGPRRPRRPRETRRTRLRTVALPGPVLPVLRRLTPCRQPRAPRQISVQVRSGRRARTAAKTGLR
ncbi:MAG: HNH endonuclease signature motif containing protein [Streptosporangiaceae bacterium]